MNSDPLFLFFQGWLRFLVGEMNLGFYFFIIIFFLYVVARVSYTPFFFFCPLLFYFKPKILSPSFQLFCHQVI